MISEDYITLEELQERHIIANNCDIRKINQAILEAVEFDLKPLLCSLKYAVEENWNSEEEVWDKLINGGEFDSCDGKETHGGLKLVLSYFVYARYVYINRVDDTVNGLVSKQNQWSVPEDYKNIRQMANKIENQALELFEGVKAYICKNKDIYPRFDFGSCRASCGCVNGCSYGKHNTGNKGITIRNIEG